MLKFSGDNDMVVSTAGSMRWIDEMNWNKTSEWDYYTLSDNQVAGFIQKYNQDKFTFATVHGSGHMVPSDQPERAYHLIFNWLFQRGEFEQKTKE